jgi:SAM-dependent methyltransferase
MSTISEQAWFETPLGEHLLAREQAYFDEVVSDIFGFNALQLGLAQYDFLRACRIPLRQSLGQHGEVGIKADFAYLPIASQSIDLLVLPHVLEFADNPHQILREAERVLMPEGHVVIAAFNPISLWGLKRFLRRQSGDYPWNGHFIALPRAKDWLALLGFEVVAGKLCCYEPPFSSVKWLDRFAFMEPAGDRWWPLAGGVYFLLAKKRVHGMRLIMPTWNERLAAQRQLAAAPQRQVPSLNKHRKEREPVV